MTELERAIWEAAGPIRKTRFALILRNARLSARDPTLPGPDDQTHGWELSFNPAIQRTFGAKTAVRLLGRSSTENPDWINWNVAAKRAVSRMAAKCWAGIDSALRAALIDEDNFDPMWGHSNVQDLRLDSPGRHLDFEGLGHPDVRTALAGVYAAMRATPAYEDAQRADRDLRGSTTKLAVWAQLAQAGHRELDAALRNLVVQDGRRRGVEIVDSIYSGTQVESVATAFRRYNRLVQQMVGSILGLAEIGSGPFVADHPVGVIRCSPGRDAPPVIRLTTMNEKAALLRLTHPVWLNSGAPIDGLHILVGYSVSFAPGALVDLSLSPLRWSAGSWP